ncbi:unnamed protein product [Calicophoron daubneyi]|uniref:T-box domain-containing protein n=1 Tax=Calicophoron daubneyi TaxID=300641 RepID=A0AAV2TDK8_CALDB
MNPNHISAYSTPKFSSEDDLRTSQTSWFPSVEGTGMRYGELQNFEAEDEMMSNLFAKTSGFITESGEHQMRHGFLSELSPPQFTNDSSSGGETQNLSTKTSTDYSSSAVTYPSDRPSYSSVSYPELAAMSTCENTLRRVTDLDVNVSQDRSTVENFINHHQFALYPTNVNVEVPISCHQFFLSKNSCGFTEGGDSLASLREWENNHCFPTHSSYPYISNASVTSAHCVASGPNEYTVLPSYENRMVDCSTTTMRPDFYYLSNHTAAPQEQTFLSMSNHSPQKTWLSYVDVSASTNGIDRPSGMCTNKFYDYKCCLHNNPLGSQAEKFCPQCCNRIGASASCANTISTVKQTSDETTCSQNVTMPWQLVNFRGLHPAVHHQRTSNPIAMPFPKRIKQDLLNLCQHSSYHGLKRGVKRRAASFSSRADIFMKSNASSGCASSKGSVHSVQALKGHPSLSFLRDLSSLAEFIPSVPKGGASKWLNESLPLFEGVEITDSSIQRNFCAHPQQPNRHIRMRLRDIKIWSDLYVHGAEMIATNSGRRLFPSLSIDVQGLIPSDEYIFIIDLVLTEPHLFKHQGGQWLISSHADEQKPAEKSVNHVYIQEDSPKTGAYWMESGVNFTRAKITNNKDTMIKNMIQVQSMRRYLPRYTILRVCSHESVTATSSNPTYTTTTGERQIDFIGSYIIPGTQFFTVTAYQNPDVIRVKIDNNPFAKGFRNRQDNGCSVDTLLYPGL